MKITFEISSEELKETIKQQIKEQAALFFQENKDSFVRDAFNKNISDLKHDGFFKRQVSSTLNKAIYDKINRECSEYVMSRVDSEINAVLKEINISNKINKIIDQKVKERLLDMIQNKSS